MRNIEPAEIVERLRFLCAQKFDSNASAFSKAAGKSRQQFDTTIISLSKAAAAGETSNVTAATLHSFALAAGSTLHWLTYGEGDPFDAEAVPPIDPGERYAVMPAVRFAARSDGIPETFVADWEARLDYDHQPNFGMLYDLLRASWNAERGKLIARKVEEGDF